MTERGKLGWGAFSGRLAARAGTLLLVLLTFSAAAEAGLILPGWWDEAFANPDGPVTYWSAFGGTMQSMGGGQSSGTITTVVDNTFSLDRYKVVFMVFEWWVPKDTGNPAGFGDVYLSWPGQASFVWEPHYSAVFVDDRGTVYQGAYEHVITPQPAEETVQFSWFGMDKKGDSLGYEYDIRTKCFTIIPEPGAALVATGTLGLLLRKKRRSRTP